MPANNLVVTFTGVDKFCDPDQLASVRSSRVEWGILWGKGEGHRYPSEPTIARWADQHRDFGLRMALHLCGAAARAWLEGDEHVTAVANKFARVQLNIIGPKHDPSNVAIKIVQAHDRGQDIIVQHNATNASLIDTMGHVPGLSVLFDSSGGRGQLPQEWPKALPGIRCGYAGGLGPETIAHALPSILAKAGPLPWIDMEGKIRDSADKLSLHACEQVLAQVEHVCTPSVMAHFKP